MIRDYPILSHIAWEVIQNMYFMCGYYILGAFLRRTLTSWKQHRCIKYEIKKHFQFGKKRLRELNAHIQKHRRTHTPANICACYKKFLLHIQVFFNVLFNRVPQGHLYKDRKAVKTNDESFLLVVSRY